MEIAQSPLQLTQDHQDPRITSKFLIVILVLGTITGKNRTFMETFTLL